MRLDRQLWNTAQILWSRKDEASKRDKREWLAEELEVSPSLGRELRFALENQDIIAGKPERIPSMDKDTELIFADLHIPFHDRKAIDKILDYAVANHNITIVSLLGDVLDMYKSSFFKKSPIKGSSIKDELAQAREMLELIRSAFPLAKIIYLEGNHEQRFIDKIDSTAPDYHELLDGLLQTKLGLADLNIEYRNKFYQIGQLWHLHGHERKGGWGVINICRVMMDRVLDNFVTAHFHQTNEIISKRIDESIIGGWAIGHTATNEAFEYNPLNKWNQGFAIVDYFENGEFTMQNKKICDGKIY